jgi:uncharacterized repeat protein (TIGR03837 family)
MSCLRVSKSELRMRWDIFCQIVDNYGDAGVCWRLARSLATRHQQQVRLFCDDLPTLNLLASDSPRTPQVQILPWEASFENARHPLDAPDVVIEAFGCHLPERYQTGLLVAAKKPIILNLEYLSAEPWIGDYHAKASPQSSGLLKYFFFPGFGQNTGGLSLDPIPAQGSQTSAAIPASLAPSWALLRPDAERISLFCYPGAPLRQWLEDLGNTQAKIDVLLTFGHAEMMGHSIGRPLDPPPSIQLISLPFVPQDDYDWLLSQCDFNIVRGEDSFIRAQLAEKPFIWHIYPQDDMAHTVKLQAFLDLYLEKASSSTQESCRMAMDWQMPSRWWNQRAEWQAHARRWRETVLEANQDGGLAARMLHFVT